VGGVFSWIIAPCVIALLIVPHTIAAIAETDGKTLFWTYLFGVMWGVGGLTFGLTMRYLGIALGYAIALGFCAAFGTLMPPVYSGEIVRILETTSGQIVFLV
jgi:L-rhamnose-H+ transport protein